MSSLVVLPLPLSQLLRSRKWQHFPVYDRNTFALTIARAANNVKLLTRTGPLKWSRGFLKDRNFGLCHTDCYAHRGTAPSMFSEALHPPVCVDHKVAIPGAKMC